MKDTIFTLLLASILVIASLVNYSLFVRTESARHALTSQTNGEKRGRVLSEQTRQGSQSWAWLLPLFGLPLLFYPFKGTVKDDEVKDSDDDFNYWPAETSYLPQYKQYTIGMKGGKASEQKEHPPQKQRTR